MATFADTTNPTPFGLYDDDNDMKDIDFMKCRDLGLARDGYVMELGRIVMEDTCERLREATDVQEFYLGMKDEGVRGRRRWNPRRPCAHWSA